MNDRRGLLPAMLFALALQLPAAANAGCGIEVLELPVKMVGARAIATVGINGTPVPLLVDTGAFFSFLTEAVTAQLKLPLHELPFGMRVQGLTGSVDARATTVDHLQLLKGDLPEIEFVVGGNEAGAGAMGLLGRNILSFTDTEYDLAHGVIRFVTPNDECEKSNMAYWAGSGPVSVLELNHEFRERLPGIRAVVALNGHRTRALFDTGATTTVSMSAAHAAGVKDSDMKLLGQMYGAGQGKTTAWVAPFDRVEIGGEAVSNNKLEVADFDLKEADMLIGIDFFLSHRIYVSKKRSLMFFTYNGGPVFALNASAPAESAAASDTVEGLSADALARRGAASLARGDLAAALADLDRACTMEPGNAGFFATRASVHAARKDPVLTLADLDTALRLDPGLADARIRRAWLQLSRHEQTQTLADLDVLDKTLPPQSNLRGEMARLFGTLDMPSQALAQWDDWIDAHPHDIGLERAYNGRCWTRAELGIDLDKALDDCDEAVDADAKNANYLDSRGWVYLRQGKLRKALADFDRGLAIRPAGAWSLYGRGLVHLGLGETAAGEADLAAARAADRRIDAEIGRSGLPRAPQAAASSPTT
jgi:predicted aspartyl protease/Tfp pilus assembly protein PilF